MLLLLLLFCGTYIIKEKDDFVRTIDALSEALVCPVLRKPQDLVQSEWKWRTKLGRCDHRIWLTTNLDGTIGLRMGTASKDLSMPTCISCRGIDSGKSMRVGMDDIRY